MSNENRDLPHQPGAAQSAQRQVCRDVPLDELKRQLGLNLIEAARDQFGSEGYAALLRYRR